MLVNLYYNILCKYSSRELSLNMLIFALWVEIHSSKLSLYFIPLSITAFLNFSLQYTWPGTWNQHLPRRVYIQHCISYLWPHSFCTIDWKHAGSRCCYRLWWLYHCYVLYFLLLYFPTLTTCKLKKENNIVALLFIWTF